MAICKLQITYHNILKMNIGLSKYESTSATGAITNTQCCQSVIRNLVYKFVYRLDKSNNTIVKAFTQGAKGVLGSRRAVKGLLLKIIYTYI